MKEQVQTGSQTWLDSTTGLASKLYALIKKKHSVKDTPYKYLEFSGKQSVIPSVLHFQPYDVSPSSLGLTIAAGLKIELAEIDGFMVPTEHPESSLDDNNSQYLQSAIRAHLINPILSDAALPTAAHNLLPRRDLDRTKQATLLAIISMAKSVFPQMDNEAIDATDMADPTNVGITIEEHHFRLNDGFNVKAGINGDTKLASKKYHCWSSYRVVHKKKNPEPKDISFLASLRPIYGTNVTLSRSKHPSLIIPH
jgi:hypothetical protein